MNCPKCQKIMIENKPGDRSSEPGWWDDFKLYCKPCHLFVRNEGDPYFAQPSGSGVAIGISDIFKYNEFKGVNK